MKHIYLLGLMFLASCSADKPEYALVIPKSQSEIIDPATQNKSAGSFKIMFQEDAKGNTLTKRLTRGTTVYGNERDTLKLLKQRAKETIVQEAIQEVNGIMIQAQSQSKVTAVSFSQGDTQKHYSRQDFTEDALAQTAGIAQVTGLKCETLPAHNDLLILACKADVKVPLIKDILYQAD